MSTDKRRLPENSKLAAVPLQIINAKVPGYKGLQQISINAAGVIQSILPMSALEPEVSLKETQQAKPEAKQILNIAGDWISLGGIDLQINGALGLAFPDLNETSKDTLWEICHYLWEQGVDGFLPTIVTTSVEKIQQSLKIIADFIHPANAWQSQGDFQNYAEILGVHLEGPFLNFQKRGAHPAEFLLPLTLENVKQVLGDYASTVKVITLAPELDPTGEVIPYLKSLGITVSLGHSMATETQADAAFKQGASMVTHGFNAMPSLHHREPGLLGAAILNPKVQCGLIADGQHVCPTMMQILLQASQYEQGIFLVSDALSPLGLPDGIYGWDSREIEIKNGTAQLPDGTLAGTTVPLLVGAQNLVKWGICEPQTAIALVTISPRKAMGMPGMIEQGAAKLLRWQIHQSAAELTLTWQRLLKN